jgi:hypothetical protein
MLQELITNTAAMLAPMPKEKEGSPVGVQTGPTAARKLLSALMIKNHPQEVCALACASTTDVYPCAVLRLWRWCPTLGLPKLVCVGLPT